MKCVEMANPVQQGLKQLLNRVKEFCNQVEMANPVQQGLKHAYEYAELARKKSSKWLIQYNKD